MAQLPPDDELARALRESALEAERRQEEDRQLQAAIEASRRDAEQVRGNGLIIPQAKSSAEAQNAGKIIEDERQQKQDRIKESKADFIDAFILAKGKGAALTGVKLITAQRDADIAWQKMQADSSAAKPKQ